MIKNMIAAAILMAPGALCAQDAPFVVNGKTDVQGRIILAYPKGNAYKMDTAVVKNGVFTFKGQLSEPMRASLQLQPASGQPEWLTLYIDKGTTTVSGAHPFSRSKVSGSATQRSHEALQQMLALVDKKQDELSASLKAASAEEKASDAFKKARREKQDAIDAEKNKVYAAFVKDHPNSIVSVDVLNMLSGPFPDLAVIEPLFNGLAPAVQQSTPGKKMAASITALKQTAVGEKAPVFAKKTPEGKVIDLASLRGQYVLVDFWASWCHPCRAENPNLIKAFDKYKAKNFTILGVSLDNEKLTDAWVKAIAEDKLTWPQVQDIGDDKAADLYGVRAIPQNFLLDPQGKIIAKNLRGEELEVKLAEVLK